MDKRALSDCAAFLDREPSDVLELHEAAELLPALLARIGLALLRRDAPIDAGVLFCDAVATAWGERPFLASALIAWAEQEGTQPQRDVFAACRALCRSGQAADLTARHLGMALRQLAESPPPAGRRVVCVRSRSGTVEWAVQ